MVQSCYSVLCSEDTWNVASLFRRQKKCQARLNITALLRSQTKSKRQGRSCRANLKSAFLVTLGCCTSKLSSVSLVSAVRAITFPTSIEWNGRRLTHGVRPGHVRQVGLKAPTAGEFTRWSSIHRTAQVSHSLCIAAAGVAVGALAVGSLTSEGDSPHLFARCQLKRTLRRPAVGEIPSTSVGNVAFVFVKPHACTPALLEFIPSFFKARGIDVLRQGTVDTAAIEEAGIIDAHYAAIARIGMSKNVAELSLGAEEAERFSTGYGQDLAKAISEGHVHSAITAMDVLSVDASDLLSQCLQAGYVKLASGLYCARLAGPGSDVTRPVYVLNGFYARMREKFLRPGVVVPWLVVRFDAAELSWQKFRSDVVGATNPSDAADGSLRAEIRDRWQELGLQEATNFQDNGVHASAGPLEAIKERRIWLGDAVEEDPLAAGLLERGVDIAALLENPVISLKGGKSGSAFDLTADMDADQALEILAWSTVSKGTMH